jgi:hypothetical protein
VKLAAACLLILLAACWLADRGEAPEVPAAVAAPGIQWMATVPDTSTPAWESMAQARVRGDDRAPPLQAPAAHELAPTPAQLADPAAYRAFEAGRTAQLMTAYAAAVDAELPRLRADVERARLAGIAPQDIAKVEAKIARLEKLRKSISETGTVID